MQLWALTDVGWTDWKKCQKISKRANFQDKGFDFPKEWNKQGIQRT